MRQDLSAVGAALNLGPLAAVSLGAVGAAPVSSITYLEPWGMVPRLRRSDHFGIDPQPSTGFPAELGGFGKLHAPFLTERRTRGLVQRCVAANPGSGLA
jgi:hypothetical protein